jgi:hypothetical protein
MNIIKRECKVVMLSTNETSKIFLSDDKTSISTMYIGVKSSNAQHLYLISDDEIKDKDNFYNPHSGHLHIAGNHTDYKGIKESNCKKVIATTDNSLEYCPFIGGQQLMTFPQPSQQFIEKFIEEYNKGIVITEVMVEYVKREIFGNNGSVFPIVYDPKINKDNNIIISDVKDTWNKDEVMALHKANCERLTNSYTSNDLNWIKEKLK